MIESPYALSKFIDAKNLVFREEERADTKFLFNMETKTSYECRDELIAMSSQPNGADGVVFGRVDFTMSLGKTRDAINDPEITEYVLNVARALPHPSQDLVVGGGVSIDALGTLKEIRSVKLSRFETRKVIFDAGSLDQDHIKKGLTEAVHFELLWLMNKRDYYGAIHAEDAIRIKMMEDRWHVLAGDEQL